jgi:predicted phosphodiesterase
MSVIEPDVRTRMLPGTGRIPVRVGVVSDTYDNRDALKQLLDRFLVAGARWLIHCGGLGSASLVDLLKPWQVYIVAGERERDRAAIETALQKARLQSTRLPNRPAIRVRIGMRRRAIYHGQTGLNPASSITYSMVTRCAAAMRRAAGRASSIPARWAGRAINHGQACWWI